MRAESTWSKARETRRAICSSLCKSAARSATASAAALVGVGAPGSQQPVLCVELEKRCGKSEQELIRRELLELGSSFPHTKEIREILFHPAFPVDIRHNAKIFREKLALWAGDNLS